MKVEIEFKNGDLTILFGITEASISCEYDDFKVYQEKSGFGSFTISDIKIIIVDNEIIYKDNAKESYDKEL